MSAGQKSAASHRQERPEFEYCIIRCQRQGLVDGRPAVQEWAQWRPWDDAAEAVDLSSQGHGPGRPGEDFSMDRRPRVVRVRCGHIPGAADGSGEMRGSSAEAPHSQCRRVVRINEEAHRPVEGTPQDARVASPERHLDPAAFRSAVRLDRWSSGNRASGAGAVVTRRP